MMLSKPNNPEGRKAYCAPTALSAITGLSVAEIEAAFLRMPSVQKRMRRARRKDAPVKGVRLIDLLEVLKALGLTADVEPLPAKALWLAAMRLDASAAYLVVVTGHVVAMQGRMVVDTLNPTPTHVSRARGNRKLAVMALRLSRT